MNNVFCFGLTPRAGLRNHVFLIPGGEAAETAWVEELAPKIELAISQAESPSGFRMAAGYAVRWHSVRQPSTGRVALEWVAIAWNPQVAPSPKVGRILEDMLASLLEDLARQMEQGRWSQGSGLVEIWPDLKNWEVGFDRKIRPSLPFAPAMGSKSPPRSLLGRFKRLGIVGLLVGIPLVALTMGALCVSAYRRWPGQVAPKANPESRWPGLRLDRTLADQDWRNLASSLGIADTVSRDRLREEIRDHLSGLFDHSAAVQSHQRTPERVPYTTEQEILKLLQDFERALGREPPSRLKELVTSSSLMTELAKLFQSKQFDPFGLVRGDPAWDKAAEFFEGYDRAQIAKWVQAVKNERPFEGWGVPPKVRSYFGEKYNDLYQAFDWLEEVNSCTLAHSGLSPESGLSRRFYLLRDRWVIDIYRAFGETVGHTLNESQSFTQWRRRLPERVNSALRSLEAEGEAADTAGRVWQDRLKALLAVLQE